MIIFAHDFDRSSSYFCIQMTKKLFVLRHAQSAGKQSSQPDYDRDLTPAGEAKVKALGEKIKKGNYDIDFILSSAATRTRLTVEAINKTLQLTSEKIQYRNELYDALLTEWIAQIHKLPNALSTVMFVGHNPGLSMLATNFHSTVVDLAPGELIAFEFDVNSWEEVGKSGKEILNIK